MKFKICGIYRITNITNQMSYIGQSENIGGRGGKEESASRCKSDPFYNSLLCQAIREYGVDQFECEILEECEPSQLNTREQYYIALYNTLVPHGYNDNDGGGVYNNLQCTMYDKQGVKIRDFNTNQEIIEYLFNIGVVKESYRYEIIKNIRKACEGTRQIVGGFRGSYQNEEIKLSEHSSKKIVYELNDNGQIIKQGFSCGDAAKELGCNTSSLARCCRGQSKTCMGRKFCYKENYTQL